MDSSGRADSAPDAQQIRVEYRLPIVIAGDDADGAAFLEPGEVLNVTKRGAFITTTRRLASGGLIALRDARAGGALVAYAQVVWTRPAGERSAGAGVRLVGDNAKWIDYLVSHSIEAIEEENQGE